MPCSNRSASATRIGGHRQCAMWRSRGPGRCRLSPVRGAMGFTQEHPLILPPAAHGHGATNGCGILLAENRPENLRRGGEGFWPLLADRKELTARPSVAGAGLRYRCITSCSNATISFSRLGDFIEDAGYRDGQRAIAPVDAVRQRNRDRTGAGGHEARREKIDLAAGFLDVFQHLVDVDPGWPTGASALVRIHSARISKSLLRVSSAKPVADQTTSRRDPVRHMETHCRSRLKHMDILRENAVARGDDHSVAGLL